MANEEQLAILRQGVAVWNEWRAQNPERPVDLREANLHGANLHGANLHGANFGEADLEGAYLRANLHGANLHGATLWGADFSTANFHRANFLWGKVSALYKLDYQHRVSRIYNRGAHLAAKLAEADLGGTDLHGAKLSETVFANVDLSTTKGLETCEHFGPSILDYRTLQRSSHLPLAFLRGCGLPDNLIEYLPSLLKEAIQYYSCFISYSSKDEAFAKRLHADLQNNGVRCWFASHDLPIGAKTWDSIDAAIRVREKVLLILSKNAINSDWVEHEVGKGFAEEHRRGQLVLFPVRIDEAVMKTDEPWAVKLRDQRNIGDFRRWKDHDAYQQAFSRVLRDLKAVRG